MRGQKGALMADLSKCVYPKRKSKENSPTMIKMVPTLLNFLSLGALSVCKDLLLGI